MEFSFSTKVIKFDSNVWHMGVTIPEDIQKAFIKQHGKRCLCTINNGKTIHVALIANKPHGYVINLNKKLQKQFQLKEGSALDIKIEEDSSPYQMAVPEELLEYWEQDEHGKHIFHELTPGKQRSLIHIMGKPKSSDIRIDKVIRIHEYLKMTGGRLDFQELNQALKK